MEKWVERDELGGKCGKSGFATVKTREQAFLALARGSSIQNVYLYHCSKWYSNWSWIESDNYDRTFFKAIADNLHDDCIREITKYLDLQHLIFFAHINDRFRTLALEKKHLCIFPSTFDSIGLTNFQYLIDMFNSSLTELSLSLNSFPSTFGHYYSHTKGLILQIISEAIELRKIHFYDFNFNESEKKDFEYFFELFSKRSIKVTFNSS